MNELLIGNVEEKRDNAAIWREDLFEKQDNAAIWWVVSVENQEEVATQR